MVDTEENSLKEEEEGSHPFTEEDQKEWDSLIPFLEKKKNALFRLGEYGD